MTIMGIARFTFPEGGAEEFKRLSLRCMDIVREQDTGTTRYEIFFNADESEAMVIEEYVDEQALIDHLGHIGPDLMAAVSATGNPHGELLGDVSEKLRAQLKDGPVQPFSHWLSMAEQA